ncbi:MAG: MOSC N-terminal beta barrel domain-containing protein [Pseudomonadota bacterium]
MTLQQIVEYPVKSMAGNTLREARVDAAGLAHDRRWMVVDSHGKFLTGRALSELPLFSAQAGTALTLQFAGETIQVEVPGSDATHLAATVWQDTLSLPDAGDAAADWLSRHLNRSVRLVYKPDSVKRWLPQAKRQQADEEVSLADGYPLLAIGTASLAALNTRLDVPVTMAHFRPNLIIETQAPHIEDQWQEIDIDGLRFRVASPCSRCVFTTVDPLKGVRSEDGEPLRTLGDYRRGDDHRIYFGVNLVPLAPGVIRQGQPVTPH